MNVTGKHVTDPNNSHVDLIISLHWLNECVTCVRINTKTQWNIQESKGSKWMNIQKDYMS